MTHADEIQRDLAGYVLGGLAAHEARTVAAHLDTCLQCRREHDELAELLPLLRLVVDPVPAPPPQLRDRIVAEAGRRRRTPVRLVGAAAALLATVAVAVGAVAVLTRPPQEPPVIVSLQAGEGFAARGEAAFRDAGDRLRIDLVLDELPELPPEAIFEAWLGVPDSDVPISIGRFHADSDGAADLALTANGALHDYTQIWVTAEPDALDPAHDGPLVSGAFLPSTDERDSGAGTGTTGS